MWGRIHEIEGYFEHHAHKPWPQTCGRIILKFDNKQTKSENHKFCHDFIRESCGKNLRRVRRTSCHVRALQIEASPEKIQELKWSHSDFKLKWRANWGLTSKFFVFAIHNLGSFMPNFGNFSDTFDNFNFFLQLNSIMWYTLKLSYNCMK